MRREYLMKKGAANTLQAVGVVVFVPSMFLTVLLCCADTIPSLLLNVLGSLAAPSQALRHPFFEWRGVIASISEATVVGLLAFSSWRMMQVGERIAKAPYVPPVTAFTLPAGEILVRSALAPAATSETLLRPVREAEQSKPEDLLRSSQP